MFVQSTSAGFARYNADRTALYPALFAQLAQLSGLPRISAEIGGGFANRCSLTPDGIEVSINPDIIQKMANNPAANRKEPLPIAAATSACLIEGLDLARSRAQKDSTVREVDVRTQLIAFGEGWVPLTPLQHALSSSQKEEACYNLLNPTSNFTLVNGTLKQVRACALAYPERSLVCLTISDGLFSDNLPAIKTVRVMEDLAREHEMYICWGMAEWADSRDCHIYNAAVLVGPEGYIGKYRKATIGPKGISTVKPGVRPPDSTNFPVFDTAIGKIGLQISRDLEYDEVTYLLAHRGAQIIASPNYWPNETGADDDQSHLERESLLTRRSKEHQVVIVDANRSG